MRGSYETQNRLEDQVSKRQEDVESWHLAKTRLDSNGGTQNKDMYHEVEQKLVKAYGVSTKDAHDMIENHDPRTEGVWNKIVDNQVSGLMHEVKAGRQRVSGEGAQQELTEFNNRYEGKITQNPGQEVQKAAILGGLNMEESKTSILGSKNNLQEKYQEITNNNNVQYGSVKHHNQIEEHRVGQKTDQYEKDRIGRGKLASGAAAVLGGVSGGAAGWDIGGPDKNVGKDYDHSFKTNIPETVAHNPNKSQLQESVLNTNHVNSNKINNR